jgi:2-aminoadipate transaminase
MDAQSLFDTAIRENVAFVPGDSFYAPDGHREDAGRQLRLNFSAVDPERIREGIRRLSMAVQEQLKRLHPQQPARSR